MPRSHPERPFFTLMPRRAVYIFFGAVFFIFSPIGLLMGSSFAQERPLHTLLISSLISGFIAISWAATFTLSRRWFVGVVVFSVLQMAFFGPLQKSWFGIGRARASVEGLGIVGAIVIGYVLFVTFILGQARATLRLQTEMDLARRIHETLVPRLEARGARFECLGVSAASSEMGGDLVDAVRHADATDLILADVSGHGVRAGVVMGMVKAAVRTTLLNPTPLGQLLSVVNRVLEQTTAPEMYSTLGVLRIPAAAAPIEYALAGHHHGYHYSAADRRLHRLEQKQFPLGLMAGSTFETASFTASTGDLILLYTDGLNETQNEAGEELGHEPIERLLAVRAGDPLPDIQKALFELAQIHGSQADDRTVLLVRIL